MNRFVALVGFIVVVAAAAVPCTKDYGDFSSPCSAPSNNEEDNENNGPSFEPLTKDWAFMMFTLTWPGSFCAQKCCKAPPGVKLQRGFTIHGLWPNFQRAGTYPQCCQSQYSLSDLQELVASNSTLVYEINNRWPALQKCQFLMYEFEKHGTCATAPGSAYSDPNDEIDSKAGLRDYINAALNLHKKYDILGALHKAGIYELGDNRASKSYSVAAVTAAIESIAGPNNFNLVCKGKKRGNAQMLLQEVRLCVAKPTKDNRANPELTECPEDHSCKNKDIVIPAWPYIEDNGCKTIIDVITP